MDSPEVFAGKMYDRGRDCVLKGVEGNLHRLATHIEIMLGDNDYGIELWQRRVLQPDNRLVEIDRLESYLLKPAREGLGLPDLFSLIQMMESIGRDGEGALKALAEHGIDRQSVAKPDLAVRAVEKGAVGVQKKTNNISISQHGTSSEYTIRRLLKEDRQDLVDKILANELSANAAAIQAGFRPITYQISEKTKPETAAAKIREKFGDEFTKDLYDSIGEYYGY